MRGPIITLAFDDGYVDTYKYAIPYLDKHGIKCTFAIPAGLIGKRCEKRPVVTWAHLKNMAAAGHDIASHTMTHVDLVNSGFIHDEITKPVKLFASHLHVTTTSFVYPYISKLPLKSVQDLTRATYASARISENKPVYNILPLKNPYSIKGFCVNDAYSPNDIEKYVEKALNDRLWLILVFHLVGKNNTKSAHRDAPYRFFTHINDFKRHVNFIVKTGVQILTQQQVISSTPPCPPSLIKRGVDLKLYPLFTKEGVWGS